VNTVPNTLLMNEKKGLLDRLVAELNRDVPNLEATVKRVSVESIEIAGTVQRSFAEFNGAPVAEGRTQPVQARDLRANFVQSVNDWVSWRD